MIKKKFFSLMVAILLGIISSIHAEVVPLEMAEHHLIHKIIENHRYCVSAFDEDKIFIRPENIISTSQGLFINLNGLELSALPLLQFNRKGHFIESSSIYDMELIVAKKGKGETKGPCPNCGVDTGKYGHCTNQECLFYGIRVL